MSFPISTFVRINAGYGEVVDYDNKTGLYKIRLVSWVLSGGQPVFVSTTVENLKSILGLVVNTMYGTGRVIDFDEKSALYRVRLISWQLSGGQPVYVSCTGHNLKIDLKQAEPTELPVGTPIKTAYGKGLIEKVRYEEQLYVIRLTSWKLSNDQPVFVTLSIPGGNYTVDLPVPVGTAVTLPQGPGKVVSYRSTDGIYEVELTKWTLSGGQKVYVYAPKEVIAPNYGAVLPVTAAAPSTAASSTSAARAEAAPEEPTPRCACVIA